jgi:hypothetical protein
MIAFHAIPGAGHNTLLVESAPEISALMQQ